MSQQSDSPARPLARYDGQDLWNKDRTHLLHPWAHFPSFEKTGSLVLAEGEGAYLYDADGRRYLDAMAGLWCVNIGYGRAEMAAAIAAQVSRLNYSSTFVDLTNPPAAELAARLCALAPAHLNHVFYGSGGSMANDTAVRIIHYYFNRLGAATKKKIISRRGAYHGSTYLAMTLTGIGADHRGFDLAPGLVHYVSAPNVYRRPEGIGVDEFCDRLVAELDAKILELGPENVAAFFAEPIMGAGGVIVPPPGYHRRCQEVCRRYGVLYVSDEVVTGFGRLGHVFCSEPVYALEPDLITCAKGLTSGYLPLGATLVSDQIYDAIRVPPAGGEFSHGFTYSGHPVCCAAALTNLSILEREDLCGRVRELGPYLERRAAELLDLPLVGDVRGSHFMLAVEYVANKQSKQMLPPAARIGSRVTRICQERGFIVRPVGHMNILSPPLVLTREQIDVLIDGLRGAIETATDEIAGEGLWTG